jgi:hypothetical protein
VVRSVAGRGLNLPRRRRYSCGAGKIEPVPPLREDFDPYQMPSGEEQCLRRWDAGDRVEGSFGAFRNTAVTNRGRKLAGVGSTGSEVAGSIANALGLMDRVAMAIFRGAKGVSKVAAEAHPG